MENTTTIDSGQTSAPMMLDMNHMSMLNEIRKWGMFLSILGFIGVGIILLVGLAFSTIMSSFTNQMQMPLPAGLFSGIYFVIAIIYFFPVLYLYRFSLNMKRALLMRSEENLTLSVQNLRSLFRFCGICAAIVISLYLIIIVTAIVVSIFRTAG
jgi:hypothetical protein